MHFNKAARNQKHRGSIQAAAASLGMPKGTKTKGNRGGGRDQSKWRKKRLKKTQNGSGKRRKLS